MSSQVISCLRKSLRSTGGGLRHSTWQTPTDVTKSMPCTRVWLIHWRHRFPGVQVHVCMRAIKSPVQPRRAWQRHVSRLRMLIKADTVERLYLHVVIGCGLVAAAHTQRPLRYLPKVPAW